MKQLHLFLKANKHYIEIFTQTPLPTEKFIAQAATLVASKYPANFFEHPNEIKEITTRETVATQLFALFPIIYALWSGRAEDFNLTEQHYSSLSPLHPTEANLIVQSSLSNILTFCTDCKIDIPDRHSNLIMKFRVTAVRFYNHVLGQAIANIVASVTIFEKSRASVIHTTSASHYPITCKTTINPDTTQVTISSITTLLKKICNATPTADVASLIKSTHQVMTDLERTLRYASTVKLPPTSQPHPQSTYQSLIHVRAGIRIVRALFPQHFNSEEKYEHIKPNSNANLGNHLSTQVQLSNHTPSSEQSTSTLRLSRYFTEKPEFSARYAFVTAVLETKPSNASAMEAYFKQYGMLNPVPLYNFLYDFYFSITAVRGNTVISGEDDACAAIKKMITLFTTYTYTSPDEIIIQWQTVSSNDEAYCKLLIKPVIDTLKRRDALSRKANTTAQQVIIQSINSIILYFNVDEQRIRQAYPNEFNVEHASADHTIINSLSMQRLKAFTVIFREKATTRTEFSKQLARFRLGKNTFYFSLRHDANSNIIDRFCDSLFTAWYRLYHDEIINNHHLYNPHHHLNNYVLTLLHNLSSANKQCNAKPTKAENNNFTIRLTLHRALNLTDIYTQLLLSLMTNERNKRQPIIRHENASRHLQSRFSLCWSSLTLYYDNIYALLKVLNDSGCVDESHRNLMVICLQKISHTFIGIANFCQAAQHKDFFPRSGNTPNGSTNEKILAQCTSIQFIIDANRNVTRCDDVKSGVAYPDIKLDTREYKSSLKINLFHTYFHRNAHRDESTQPADAQPVDSIGKANKQEVFPLAAGLRALNTDKRLFLCETLPSVSFKNINIISEFLRKHPCWFYFYDLHCNALDFYESLAQAMAMNTRTVRTPACLILTALCDGIKDNQEELDVLSTEMKLWRKELARKKTNYIFLRPIFNAISLLHLPSITQKKKRNIQSVLKFFGFDRASLEQCDLYASYKHDFLNDYLKSLRDTLSQEIGLLRSMGANKNQIPAEHDLKIIENLLYEATQNAKKEARMHRDNLIAEEYKKKCTSLQQVMNEPSNVSYQDVLNAASQMTHVMHIATAGNNTQPYIQLSTSDVNTQIAILKSNRPITQIKLIRSWEELWCTVGKSNYKHHSCMHIAAHLMHCYAIEMEQIIKYPSTVSSNATCTNTITTKATQLQRVVDNSSRMKQGIRDYFSFCCDYMRLRLIAMRMTYEGNTKIPSKKHMNSLVSLYKKIKVKASTNKAKLQCNQQHQIEALKNLIKSQPPMIAKQLAPSLTKRKTTSKPLLSASNRRNPLKVNSTHESKTSQLEQLWFSKPKSIYSQEAIALFEELTNSPTNDTQYNSSGKPLSTVAINNHFYALMIMLAEKNIPNRKKLADTLLCSLRLDESILGESSFAILACFQKMIMGYVEQNEGISVELILFGSQAEKIYHSLRATQGTGKEEHKQAQPTDLDILIYYNGDSSLLLEFAMLFSRYADVYLADARLTKKGQFLVYYKENSNQHTYHGVPIEVNGVIVSVDVTISQQRPTPVFEHSAYYTLYPKSELRLNGQMSCPQVTLMERFLDNIVDLNPKVPHDSDTIAVFVIRKAHQYMQRGLRPGTELRRFLDDLLANGGRVVKLLNYFQQRYSQKQYTRDYYQSLMTHPWPYKGGYMTFDAILNSCKTLTSRLAPDCKSNNIESKQRLCY